MGLDCPECVRLWKEYSQATHEHCKIDGRLRIAALAHEDDQIRELLPQAEAALEARTRLRDMIRDHEKNAHLTLPQTHTVGE